MIVALALVAGVMAVSAEKIVIDMVHNNPGEAYTQSMFNNPKTLLDYGYNGQVINEFTPPNCAVTFDAVNTEVFPAGSAEREWVMALQRRTNEQIEAAHKQGLKIYYFMDIILLPKRLVELEKDAICDSKGKIDFSKPRTQQLHREMLREILQVFPALDGVVVRTGENYRQNVPYHAGNELANNANKHEAVAKHSLLAKMLREEFCERGGKEVIYRTWDYNPWDSHRGYLHTRPDYYMAVSEAVEPHPLFQFGIKHTAGDYFRTFEFNPTIGIGKHRQVIEVQCQREYEGKNAYANYIAHGVISGFEENLGAKKPMCLSDIENSELMAGVWTWTRGGGWGGPYIKNEFWCAANAYVVANWVKNPKRSEQDYFVELAMKWGFDRESALTLHKIALMSEKAIVRGRATLVAPIKAIELEWTRDDNVRADRLTDFIKEAYKKGITHQLIDEKYEAMNMWNEMLALSRTLRCSNADNLAAVQASVEYGKYFFTYACYGWAVLLTGNLNISDGKDAEVRYFLREFDYNLHCWREFCKTNPWAATMYNTSDFDKALDAYRNKGIMVED